MRILIVNDDGIYSPGIAMLAGVARRFGEVRVVAPDVERSSAGHSITSARPVRARRTKLFEGIPALRVDGTPADCVALGVFLWKDVDVVLSGVNMGPNLGNAIWHSGTLAAAKQATLLGVRGIALRRAVTDDDPDFSALEPWVERVVARPSTSAAPASSTSTSRASRSTCAGRPSPWRSTTAGSSRARTRWAASTTGSPWSRSSATPRGRTSGRS